MADYLDSLLDAQAAKAPPDVAAGSGDFLDALLDKRANEKPVNSESWKSQSPGEGMSQYADPKTGRIYYAKPQDQPVASGSDSPMGVAAGKLVKGAMYLPQKVASGFRGMADLVTGQGLDTAAADVRQGQQFTEANATSPAAQATEAVVGSKYNPLNWPAMGIQKGAQAVSAGLQKVGVPEEAARAIPEAGLDIAALFGLKKSMESGGAVPPDEGNWPSPFTPKPKGPQGVQEALNQQYAGQSMGAAASAPNLLNVSPALRDKVTGLVEKGGELHKEALARHAEAESLPVPAQLTRGQARQDSALMSDEFNAKGKHPEIGTRFNEQNANMVENVRTIREQVGPDVFTTNPVEHGETLIGAYKAKDAAIKADITAKYQALKDANGGEFPVDGQAFVQAADSALKSNMKRPFLPGGVERILQQYRDGDQMTFENFENLRTTLAAEARKADRGGDGNAAAAVNMVRDSLEALPIAGESAKIKMLADQARQAARERFQALEADPAYKAAVNETVPADRFVQKYVIGGTKDGVTTMRKNLSGDDTALQTMSVSALDHLRQQSGIDSGYNGNFSQAGFNKALEGLSPKMQALVPPKVAEQLSSVGNVARWQQQQKRGSYANNSHTFVAAAKDAAANALEGMANVKAGGIPVGTGIRRWVGNKAAKQWVEQTLEPGAGIEK
ncbi:hypothetical protein UFOVP154_46 [uncultured Caudovirales phage]|uniref:Uncharacterized protein n=1 Tax=uncultured Caudovirales phage TaxID=2100421 RepID=A0A6J7WC66_9CAUD|nr:hypothetical protein UFOVP8_31 [uncultured Caudovirales phage]CAB5170757.1 hypothetical protein UFOVP154_46 [uncultured Caudovirales phage]